MSLTKIGKKGKCQHRGARICASRRRHIKTFMQLLGSEKAPNPDNPPKAAVLKAEQRFFRRTSN